MPGGGAIGAGREAIVGRGLIEILPDFRKWGKTLAADMRTARAQMDGTARGFKASAGTIGVAMAQAGKGASLVGLGVAAASVKMAGDFQKETAVLQTAAGESAKGLGVVRKGILGLSENTGTGIKQLTDGMYTIEKAGFRGASGLKILTAAAQGAREENANLADVTNAMTSVMASYHLKAGKAVEVMNALKTAAGEGKITMEEFSGALSTVLPVASANKISFEQVAGAVATLTQHGTSAREATMELAGTITRLAGPNNVAQREMARFGLSALDVSTKLGKRGLTGTFDLLTSTILHKMGPSGKILLSAFEGTKQASQDATIMLGKMPPSLRKMAKEFLSGKMSIGEWRQEMKTVPTTQAPMLQGFTTLVGRSKGFSRELKSGGPAAKTYTDALRKMAGGSIGLNTILQLTGESASGFKDRVSKVGASLRHNTKDVEGWKVTQGLLNVQLDMAKQRLQVLAINIGTKLIPVVVTIVKLFTEHKTITALLVGGILAFIAALSAAYVISKLYAGTMKIVSAAQVLWNGSLRIGRALALGTRVQLAALWAQEKLVAIWSKAVLLAQKLWNAALTIGRGLVLKTRIQLALLWAQEKLVAFWSKVVTIAQWAWNAALTANPIGLVIVAIGLLVAGFILAWKHSETFRKIVKAALGAVWDVAKAVGHWFAHDFVDFFTKTIPAGFKFLLDWVKGHWPWILGALTGPVGLAAAFIITHWKLVRDFFVSAWGLIKRNAIDPLIHFFTSTIPNAGRAMRDAIIGFVRAMVLHVLDSFGAIIHGAAHLFGWVPGVGGKLKSAAKAFDNFRNDVNKALGGIKDRHPTVGVGMTIMTGKNSGLVNIGGIARAKGGAIDGPGTETSDDVLMWGSRNEHMWTAKEVRAAGGHQAMARLRKMALAGLLKGYRYGGEIQGYAQGGAVDVRSHAPGGRAVNSGTNSAFANFMRANVWTLIKAFKAAQAAAAGPSFVGLGGVGKSAASAMSYAQKLLNAHIYGWTMAQWPSWRSLGMGESGWRWNALNKSSGAYGIPQALPAGKMRSAGADWRTNALTQVRWMASYIHSVYGTPANAWHRWLSRSPHWYDAGGLAKRIGTIFKGTNQPERILSPQQTAAFERLVDKLPHGGRGGGGDGLVIQRVELHNHGVIGSQHEVEDWLVGSFDRLQRKGRIRVITRTSGG
jgi:TP901 family phage tail tape measure protein